MNDIKFEKGTSYCAYKGQFIKDSECHYCHHLCKSNPNTMLDYKYDEDKYKNVILNKIIDYPDDDWIDPFGL